jgi:copper transport protein
MSRLVIRRGGRPARRAALLAGITFLLLLVGAGPAWAHATLEGTDPTDGTLLATAPSTVTLTFSEPITVDDGGVRLLTPAGTELPSTVTTVDNKVVITPTTALGTGTVIVSWQVISADSHPVSGGFTFAVGQRTAGTVAVPTADQDTGVRIATALAQALAYLGALACCGLIAFDVLVLRGTGDDGVCGRIRRISGWSAGIAVLAAVLLMPLTELRQRFLTLGGLLDPQTWTAQMSQDSGLTAVLVAAGVLLAWEAAWAVNRRTAASAGAALAGCGVALGAFAVVGHTRGYGPVALVLTADLLHLTVAAFWLGGLIGLGLLLRGIGRDPVTPASPPTKGGRVTTVTRSRPAPRAQVQATTQALSRFSSWAAVLVALLAVAGGLMAWRILGSWAALVDTGYGQALLVKLFLVASAVAVAGYNRYRALPAVVAAPDTDAAWRRLRRTVTAEATILVAVLAVTGWLVNANPALDNGTSSNPATATTVEQTVPLGSDTVTVRITPGIVGINSLEFTVTDPAGQPVQPVSDPQVSVTMPAAGVGPLTRPVTSTGPAAYQAVLDLPLSGQWVVTIAVRTSEFEQPSASIQVNLP